MTNAWYGKSTAKQLQQLIDSKPKLVNLLSFVDFQQQLKSYNTKLLQYVTNNPSLIGQAIELITTAPNGNDTYQRKHKYPLQVIEMIQTQTTCVLNSFFKQVSQNKNGLYYFDCLFNILNENQILPLLAGYFFRTNLCLLNNRYKQSIDRIYLKPQILQKLLNHSKLMPIANTIQLYLNLDVNKSSQSQEQRLKVKKDLLSSIISRIDYQRKTKSLDSSLIIENLIVVLIQSIEKYYLILDGKAMMDIITSQETIEVMISIIKQNSQISHNAFNFFISLINYYSFSSYNSDEGDSSQIKLKNLERLQNQPMVQSLNKFFSQAVEKIMKVKLFTLYQYRLLQILCHCISISSLKIFKTICQTNFFGNLITLLFKHQDNNILHMLIQKSFLHVFISERKIYDQYKRHLFCQLDIIEITANKVIKSFSQGNLFQILKKKKYFGHFMRILKIYSGIQTTDQSIIGAIKSKTQIWNKISTNLIKPYQSICFKELGTYQNIPQPKNQQFIMKKIDNVSPQSLKQNTNVLQQIRKQEMMEALICEKKEQPVNFKSKQLQQKIIQKTKEDQLLKAPTHNLLVDVKQFQIKKTESFKDFMNKKKVQAEHQIKLKRSLSKQKSLSGNNSKGKMTNPSPNKKNSWRQQKNDVKTSIGSKNNDGSVSPKLHHIPKKSISTNSNTIQFSTDKHSRVSTQQNRLNEQIQNQSNITKFQNISLQTKSLTSLSRQKDKLESIKKIKVIRIDTPKQKKYRRIQDKDMLLLDFLGINR